MEHQGTLREKDIACLRHLRRVFPLLDRLHEVGCGRDRAGNREMRFNVYCKLVLLYIWNPLIGSVRMLRQAVGLANVAKALGIGRFSLGSFSETPRVFEPEQLKAVAEELVGELQPLSKDPRLGDVKHAITLVDSTVLTALSRLARSAAAVEARYNTARDGHAVYGWRLHTQLDLQTFSPPRSAQLPTLPGGSRLRMPSSASSRVASAARRNIERIEATSEKLRSTFPTAGARPTCWWPSGRGATAR